MAKRKLRKKYQKLVYVTGSGDLDYVRVDYKDRIRLDKLVRFLRTLGMDAAKVSTSSLTVFVRALHKSNKKRHGHIYKPSRASVKKKQTS